MAGKATMSFAEAVRIAASSLWAHKLRSVLTLVGGVVAILGGMGISLAVRSLAPSLPATISAFWVAAGLVTAASIGLIFGMYPAWKAARLDPVVALRYE
jgi:ABC-type antimicrobial peptide transport system permease subunit